MKKVLFINLNKFLNNNIKPFLRCFPDEIALWNNYNFELTNSLQERKSNKYDYIVFYSENNNNALKYKTYSPFEFIGEIENIEHRAVLHIGFESKTVVDYNNVYKKLFNELPYRNFYFYYLQKDFNHKNFRNINFIPIIPHNFIGCDNEKINYDFLSKNSPKKDAQIALISSNSSYAKGHDLRNQFAKKIKEKLGNEIEIFGRGVKDFENKYKSMANFKYQIIIENGVEENYCSEKLVDCFLSESYPIYFGCPNVFDFFSKDSLSIIDINNFDESLDQINKIIKDDLFTKRYKNIKHEKLRCLNKYNIFNIIRNYCEDLNV